MRYLILHPREAEFDPRTVQYRDLSHLHDMIPPVGDHEREVDAHAAVRRELPNALAMPFTVKVGSGVVVLLGLLEEPSQTVDPNDEIPFAMFVHAMSETDADREHIRRASAGLRPLFDRKLWRLRPVRPDIGKIVEVEWRTSELEAPAYLQAKIGHGPDGRLVVFAELGEHSMSLSFPKGVVLTDVVKEENDRAADRADRMSY